MTIPKNRNSAKLRVLILKNEQHSLGWWNFFRHQQIRNEIKKICAYHKLHELKL